MIAPATRRHRPTSSMLASLIPRAISSPSSGSGSTFAISRRSEAVVRSAACVARSSCTTFGCVNGRTSTLNCARPARNWGSRSAQAQPTQQLFTAPCSPGSSPTSVPTTPFVATISALAGHAGRSTPAPRCHVSLRSSRWQVNSWRHPACSVAWLPGSIQSRSSRWRAICCSAAIPSLDGRPSAYPWSPTSGSRSTECRWWWPDGCSTAGSILWSRASCSSVMHSSRGSGSATITSCGITRHSSLRSQSSRTGSVAATC
ncbi:unannotated protein [freshwater metagenome]|uniref:Unannotated protein n=1 Tax=freshwater metagenome TaxID=449393 RepID=A0A6J7C1I4_9ZZZZ